MKEKVSFQSFEHYFLATVLIPEMSADDLRELLIHVRDRVSHNGHHRILLDLRALLGVTDEFDRYLAGKAIANLLNDPFRLAALARADLINKFAEDTAVGRGATFMVCSSEEEALEWLLEDESP